MFLFSCVTLLAFCDNAYQEVGILNKIYPLSHTALLVPSERMISLEERNKNIGIYLAIRQCITYDSGSLSLKFTAIHAYPLHKVQEIGVCKSMVHKVNYW